MRRLHRHGAWVQADAVEKAGSAAELAREGPAVWRAAVAADEGAQAVCQHPSSQMHRGYGLQEPHGAGRWALPRRSLLVHAHIVNQVAQREDRVVNALLASPGASDGEVN